MNPAVSFAIVINFVGSIRSSVRYIFTPPALLSVNRRKVDSPRHGVSMVVTMKHTISTFPSPPPSSTDFFDERGHKSLA